MSPQRSTGQEPITHDIETLSVSKRLVRSMSQKLKIKPPLNEASEEYDDNEDETSGVSLRCLTLYARGAGCRVSADMSEYSGDDHHHHHPTGGRRRSSACEDGRGDSTTAINCFSHAVREKLFRRAHKRILAPDGPTNTEHSSVNACLPDDVLEMCLVRLPLTSVMTARLVCKKWRALTSTARFMRARREGPHRTPWLFLFGVVREGYCSGEVHALDVSLDMWHKIDSHALKGRFLFSVASLQDEIFIVGGCSSLTNFGRVDRSSFKTHKGLLVFSPLTKSWRKGASMRHARSSPILGVSEVGPDCSALKRHQGRVERRFYQASASDVYEDPHRLSVRRQSRCSFDESESSVLRGFKSGQTKNEGPCRKEGKRFVMIAVGGLGSWDEPLDSCEIYDPVSNKWADIQRLPLDFGQARAGAACLGVFYVYSESDALAGYDIERGYWVRVEVDPGPARIREYYPKLVGCGARLFVLSVSWCEGDGRIGRRNKAVRKLWELDLGGPGWREVGAHPDAPMDWNAAFVADDGCIFGIEMFKIFGQVLDFVTVFDSGRAGPGRGWGHISRNRMAHGLDASSCMTKSVAVVRL